MDDKDQRIAELELRNLELEARVANLLVVLGRTQPNHTTGTMTEAEERRLRVEVTRARVALVLAEKRRRLQAPEERAADAALPWRRGQGLEVTR
jgi:hypothetical protein